MQKNYQQVLSPLKLSESELKLFKEIEPRVLGELVRLLYDFMIRSPNRSVQVFCNALKNSDYPPCDFAEAFILLCNELAISDKKASLLDIVSYITCCEHANDQSTSLKQQVKFFYLNYGMDKAV